MLDGDDTILIGLLDSILHGNESAVTVLFDLITEREKENENNVWNYQKLPDVRYFCVQEDPENKGIWFFHYCTSRYSKPEFSNRMGWKESYEEALKLRRMQILRSFGFEVSRESREGYRHNDVRDIWMEWPKIIYKLK